MRWTILDCPDGGSCYVDLFSVAAIGPVVTESVGGREIAMRLIYLSGGQGLAILDSAANMAKLLHTLSARPS